MSKEYVVDDGDDGMILGDDALAGNDEGANLSPPQYDFRLNEQPLPHVQEQGHGQREPTADAPQQQQQQEPEPHYIVQSINIPIHRHSKCGHCGKSASDVVDNKCGACWGDRPRTLEATSASSVNAMTMTTINDLFFKATQSKATTMHSFQVGTVQRVAPDSAASATCGTCNARKPDVVDNKCGDCSGTTGKRAYRADAPPPRPDTAFSSVCGKCSCRSSDVVDGKCASCWEKFTPTIQSTVLKLEETTAQDYAQRRSGILTLSCMRATDLPAMDKNGFSDPYLIGFYTPVDQPREKQRLKTKVIKKTLDPVWQDTLEFCMVILGEGGQLQLTIMDKDTLRSDDFIATTWIPLDRIPFAQYPGGVKLCVDIGNFNGKDAHLFVTLAFRDVRSISI